MPTAQWVTVLPNQYEKGRATIAVYNWSGAATATADLSGVLQPGQAYEVRNAQRFWDAPVLTGTYSGPLALPIVAVAPYSPIAGRPKTGTGTTFQVFVVAPVGTLPR